MTQKVLPIYYWIKEHFDDPGYHTRAPSFSFLLSQTIEEVELRVPYYGRKMQIVSGQNHSADHTHKVAKVVLIE